jgi:hypothetical protein
MAEACVSYPSTTLRVVPLPVASGAREALTTLDCHTVLVH